MKHETFHEQLRKKMDAYAHIVYTPTKNFPKEEMFGVTSQLRRAALSVILNYIEGYARIRTKVHKNFIGISYGSLQESKYLLDFSTKENYLTKESYSKMVGLADDIGAMLWGVLRNLKS